MAEGDAEVEAEAEVDAAPFLLALASSALRFDLKVSATRILPAGIRGERIPSSEEGGSEEEEGEGRNDPSGGVSNPTLGRAPIAFPSPSLLHPPPPPPLTHFVLMIQPWLSPDSTPSRNISYNGEHMRWAMYIWRHLRGNRSGSDVHTAVQW